MTNKEAVIILEEQKRYVHENSRPDKALDMAISALEYTEFMKNVHTCNDCGWKTCPYKPKLGETVRYNCFQWRRIE